MQDEVNVEMIPLVMVNELLELLPPDFALYSVLHLSMNHKAQPTTSKEI